MREHGAKAERPPGQLPLVRSCLQQLGIAEDSELAEFFREYRLSSVLSARTVEILDVCSPTPQLLAATEFARDTYQMPEDAICLTSGEGEAFIVLSKRNGKVYDLGVAQLPAFESGNLAPKWDSFFALLRWYLSK